MLNVRRLLIGFTIVAATVVAMPAHAQRKMLVLIDASGSMSTVRVGSSGSGAVVPRPICASGALRGRSSMMAGRGAGLDSL